MSIPTERRVCKLCEKAGWDQGVAECAYCGMGLSSRHEHDHMPVPKRHGGTEVIPVCLNCHDLKDRIPVGEWRVKDVSEAIEGLNTYARIIVAICIASWHDARGFAEDHTQVRTEFLEDLERTRKHRAEVSERWMETVRNGDPSDELQHELDKAHRDFDCAISLVLGERK